VGSGLLSRREMQLRAPVRIPVFTQRGTGTGQSVPKLTAMVIYPIASFAGYMVHFCGGASVGKLGKNGARHLTPESAHLSFSVVDKGWGGLE
jgi:hypothetical protein